MTPEITLIAQASTLLEDVEHQRAMLTAFAAPSHPQAGANANGMVATQLRGKLANVARDLETLMGDACNGTDLGTMRRSYQEISDQCRDLFGECLAVSIAPAMRPLSNGACDIVEKFLRGLGVMVGVPWRHLTTLSDSEFLGTASQVIRLRYPSSTVWDFPVAAHEFGHFVGPRWPKPDRQLNGYQDFLTEQELSSNPSYLKEYFADMFATFVLGPAFVNTCLLHRFNPAGEEGDSHPSDRQRAVGILAGLYMLSGDSEPYTRTILRDMHQKRTEEWEQAVTESGATPVGEHFTGRMQGSLRALWESLKDWSGDAAFTDIHVSFQLRPDAGGVIPVTARVRDVLNAAWLVRLETPTNLLEPWRRTAYAREISRIDAWAKNLCMGVPE